MVRYGHLPEFLTGRSTENELGRDRFAPSGVGGGLKQNLCWKLIFMMPFRFSPSPNLNSV